MLEYCKYCRITGLMTIKCSVKSCEFLHDCEVRNVSNKDNNRRSKRSISIKLKPEELEGFISSIHWQIFRQSNTKIAVHLLLNGKNLKKCLEYAYKTNNEIMFSQCLDIAEYKTKPYFVNRRSIK